MGRCLKVLLVDDDSTCLVIVGAMLRKLHFQVVTAKTPQDALGTLRAKGGFEFDLVISDVHMPDINGFQLQMMISNEFNPLPVVLMSGDNHEGVVRQGMQNGAISFIEKPVSANALTCLWRFLTSQRKGEVRCSTMEVQVDTIAAPAAAVVSSGCSRGHGRTAAAGRSGAEPGAAVKKKMVWTDPLHFKFLDAVNTLGIENAVPKNILKAMNVKGLTRENVASHLQKYRQFLRRNIQELENGLLSNTNSGAGYQPRFAPKRVSRFAKLEQLFTHAQLEAASAAVSPSPSTGNTLCAAPPLSEHDESLFYRGWTRDPIPGNANSHYPSPETFFPNGSGEYESSSSCFGNFDVAPGNVEQSQNMGAAGYYDNVRPENDDLLSGVLNFIGESEDGGVGEGYSSTCSYSTPQQYFVPQFGESDMMQVSPPPQQSFPMDLPAGFGGWGGNHSTSICEVSAALNPICEFSMLQNMAAAGHDNSGGYQFNHYHPNNDQQVGNEEGLMMNKYNTDEGVGFEQWYDYSQWLSQPFLQEQAIMEGVRYGGRQLVQTSQQNLSQHYYSKASHQRDNEDDDNFVQSIFATNPYGVGAANAQGF